MIFDTDMGNDVDDALALAMLHALASRGEVKLLAVTVSKDNPWAAKYVRLVDEYYGRGAIPVGIVHDGKETQDGFYIRQVCELHGGRPIRQPYRRGRTAEQDVGRQSDGAVTLIQVGFSTNLARSVESAPDRDSNLSGMDLVKKKKFVLLTVMAGNFAEAKRSTT